MSDGADGGRARTGNTWMARDADGAALMARKWSHGKGEMGRHTLAHMAHDCRGARGLREMGSCCKPNLATRHWAIKKDKREDEKHWMHIPPAPSRGLTGEASDEGTGSVLHSQKEWMIMLRGR